MRCAVCAVWFLLCAVCDVLVLAVLFMSMPYAGRSLDCVPVLCVLVFVLIVCAVCTSVCTVFLLDVLCVLRSVDVLLMNMQYAGRSYDFSQVISWFADRSDMILLLFDAHKLDISDEFKNAIMQLKVASNCPKPSKSIALSFFLFFVSWCSSSRRLSSS